MDDQKEKLSWKEKLGYGLGGFTMAITICLGNFLTVYLTNTAFLDIAVVSTILAVSRIFDGISDILVGNLIDSTNTIHGKARVWIRRTALPIAISAVLLYFDPKSWPDGVRYVYVFLMYNIFTSVFSTFFIVSHNALLSLITSDSAEHRRLSSIAGFFQRIVFMLVSAVFVKLLMVFTSKPGDPMTQRGYTCVILILGGLMTFLCLAEFYLTKERVVTNGYERSSSHFLTNLKLLLANKYWVIMLISTALFYGASSCFDGSMNYYTIYVLGDYGAMTLFSFVIGAGGIAATIILFVAGPKLRTAKTFVVSLILLALGIFGIYLAGPHNRILLIAALVVVGTGVGSSPVLMQTLITEIIFYSQRTSGKLIPGTGNACMNAMRKLGLGLSMAGFGYIMAASGFDAKLDAQGVMQPDTVIKAIKTGFFVIPILSYTVIAIIFLLFFDMKNKQSDYNTVRSENG